MDSINELLVTYLQSLKSNSFWYVDDKYTVTWNNNKLIVNTAEINDLTSVDCAIVAHILNDSCGSMIVKSPVPLLETLSKEEKIKVEIACSDIKLKGVSLYMISDGTLNCSLYVTPDKKYAVAIDKWEFRHMLNNLPDYSIGSIYKFHAERDDIILNTSLVHDDNALSFLNCVQYRVDKIPTWSDWMMSRMNRVS